MRAECSWSPRSSVWALLIGIRSRGAPSSASPGGAGAPTWCARPWKRWRTRRATSSTPCRATPAGCLMSCASTAAPRSWTFSASSRQTCGSSTGASNPPSPETTPTRSRRSGDAPWKGAGRGRPAIISSLSSTGARAPRGRQRILYAEELWRWQRFYAGLLVVVGVLAAGVEVYSRQPINSQNLIWLFYAPVGLLLGAAFFVYRWRSFVEPLDKGLKVSTLFSDIVIEYDSIRMVKVQPLKVAFQDARRAKVARIMRPLLEKPALFVRVRGDEEQLALIKKRLGSRLFYEDTIAMPVPDADAASWEITARLPYRIGQNQGGGRRKKRRR